MSCTLYHRYVNNARRPRHIYACARARARGLAVYIYDV
eukprot:COSAG02_NODE_23648_length_712_cov_0.838499_1_plen_37_part_10